MITIILIIFIIFILPVVANLYYNYNLNHIDRVQRYLKNGENMLIYNK